MSKRKEIISLVVDETVDTIIDKIDEVLVDYMYEYGDYEESNDVFFNDKGKPFKGVKRPFDSALSRAKITDLTFHDLRHTFASQLVMAGVNLKAVQELLGHKTIKMTLRYAHLADEHKAKAVEMLDNRINKSKTGQKLDNSSNEGYSNVS